MALGEAERGSSLLTSGCESSAGSSESDLFIHIFRVRRQKALAYLIRNRAQSQITLLLIADHLLERGGHGRTL